MRLVLLLFVLLWVASPAAAGPIEDAIASPQRTDADRKRDATSKPAEVLGFFGIEPGMQVLDLISGGER